MNKKTKSAKPRATRPASLSPRGEAVHPVKIETSYLLGKYRLNTVVTTCDGREDLRPLWNLDPGLPGDYETPVEAVEANYGEALGMANELDRSKASAALFNPHSCLMGSALSLLIGYPRLYVNGLILIGCDKLLGKTSPVPLEVFERSDGTAWGVFEDDETAARYEMPIEYHENGLVDQPGRHAFNALVEALKRTLGRSGSGCADTAKLALDSLVDRLEHVANDEGGEITRAVERLEVELEKVSASCSTSDDRDPKTVALEKLAILFVRKYVEYRKAKNIVSKKTTLDRLLKESADARSCYAASNKSGKMAGTSSLNKVRDIDKKLACGKIHLPDELAREYALIVENETRGGASSKRC